jgi:hypothetical protein
MQAVNSYSFLILKAGTALNARIPHFLRDWTVAPLPLRANRKLAPGKGY